MSSKPPTAPRGGGGGGGLRPVSIRNFNSMIQGNVRIEAIFRLYSKRVAPFYQSVEQVPFIRALMAKARWFSDSQNDTNSMIAIWTFAHSQNIPADSKDRIIRTMVEVGNRTSNQDIEIAIKIWSAAYQIAEGEKAVGIISNMWTFARNYLSRELSSQQKKVVPALKILNAIFTLYDSHQIRDSVLQFTIKTFAQSKALCQRGIAFLGKDNNNNFDPYFHAMLFIGLLYGLGKYQEVISYINSQANPPPTLVIRKAEAFRKLKVHERSTKIATSIIRKFSRRPNLNPLEARALIDALNCRGFSRAEKGRNKKDSKHLRKALEDFELAIAKAQEHNFPSMPRPYNGLRYVYELMGKNEEALQAAQKALELDQDNVKAIDGVSRLTPPPTSRR
jgi:hypothetical protein